MLIYPVIIQMALNFKILSAIYNVTNLQLYK